MTVKVAAQAGGGVQENRGQGWHRPRRREQGKVQKNLQHCIYNSALQKLHGGQLEPLAMQGKGVGNERKRNGESRRFTPLCPCNFSHNDHRKKYMNPVSIQKLQCSKFKLYSFSKIFTSALNSFPQLMWLNINMWKFLKHFLSTL